MHLLATLVSFLAVASGSGPTTAPQPPECPLWVPPAAREFRIGLGDGAYVLARDPYGGLMPRNRLFFDFRLRGAPEALARIAQAEWALNGVTKRVDPTAPFSWFGLSSAETRIPPGDHVVRVTVVLATGERRSVEFALGATDCQAAAFDAFIVRPGRRGASMLQWFASFEGPPTAPPLDGVGARARRNVRTALPAAVRGRVVGRLDLGIPPGGATPTRSYTLRAPRHGTTLLRRGALRVLLRPGRTRFLDVTGLPDGTQNVSVLLRGAGRRLVALRAPCRPYSVAGVFTAGATTVSDSSGGQWQCR